MMQFVGAYEGILKASALHGTLSVNSERIGSRIAIESGFDQALISRLSRWAVTDLLKGAPQTPCFGLLPEMAALPRAGEVGLDDIDMALGGLDSCLDMDFGLVSSEYSAPGAETAPDVMGADGWPAGSSSCSSGTGVLVVERLEDSQGDGDAAEAEAEASGGDEDLMNMVERITGGLGKERKAESGRTVCIAPKRVLKQAEVEVGDQERRMALRKQRNREAAQRSNLKRKQRNDGLKNALRESYARAQELRAREILLREENLRLRKLSSS